MLYAAATLAGAMVEILVQYAAVPKGMCQSTIEIPDDVSVSEVSSGVLPADWARDLESTRTVGSTWFKGQISAVLIVPSCVAHGEKNYLLNTQHPDFERVRFSSSSSFVFDPRLK